jgi:DNA processing protein
MVAHTEALKNNISTVGVLAHGLHLIYPSQHKKLAQEMIENGGAIISEFNSTDKPDREHFLQRNRIVAGFSSITIVVETAFGGGSMSTVSYANGYNREVYASWKNFGQIQPRLQSYYLSEQSQNHQKFQDILDELH